jgi:DNA-binding winged helix-turn-helix (wHTH) protein
MNETQAVSAVALVNCAELQRLQLCSKLEQWGYTPVVFATASELLVSLGNGRRFELLLLVEDDFVTWNCLAAVSRVLGIPTLLLTDALDWIAQVGPGQDFQQPPLFDFALLTGHEGELNIRMRALLQRAREQRVDRRSDVTAGDYVFLENSQSVTYRGREIMLQPRQFGVALELFRNVGRVVSRDSLWSLLWHTPTAPEGARALDVCVANVRRKLDLREERGFTLHAVYRRGYQLRAMVPRTAAEAAPMTSLRGHFDAGSRSAGSAAHAAYSPT